MGGYFGDMFGMKYGLKGRVHFLFVVLLGSGLALMLFSRMTALPVAIAVMILFSLLVQMSEGATYSVVPFVNKKSIGVVSGIVGAGGNAGAVGAGFLFRYESLPYGDALFILGCIVAVCSISSLAVRFTAKEEAAAEQEMVRSLRGAAGRPSHSSGALHQPQSNGLKSAPEMELELMELEEQLKESKNSLLKPDSEQERSLQELNNDHFTFKS
ncbi:MAG: hypothetical protein WD355_06410, partial [Balneolaceae bacterium]